MKVALVCDWLTNVGGAEKVLLKIHKLYPKAPIYTSKYDSKGIDWFKDADIRTGWLQIFPSRMRRLLGPLRQRYFNKLDLSGYDLIISVTGAEAKSVKSGKKLVEEGKSAKNPNGVHLSYCHVPTQYYWQMYDDYVKNPGFGVLNPVVRFFFKLIVGPLRKADYKAAQSPDYFITISDYAKEQIEKYYNREAVVIHPPVEIEDFERKVDNRIVVEKSVEKYYITTSRQVNWKRIDLAVEACRGLERKLLVIGEGPEHKNLVKLAGGSKFIKFLPLMKKEKLAKYLVGAKGYLFPSLEPFGIAPVEALAAGCPVIAYGVGGARDYVKDGINGMLFKPQSAEALAKTILKFEKKKFDREKVASSVDDYSEARFDKEMRTFVKKYAREKNGEN